MNIVPMGNRVLAERREVPAVAGILLPQGAGAAFTLHVLDVGEGQRLDDGSLLPVPYKAGDEIVTYQGGVLELPAQLYGGKHYCLIECSGIVCKVERDNVTDGMGKVIVRGKAVAV